MEGIGNDFVVIDAAEWQPLRASELATVLCERRWSVGGDGLLVLESGERYRMRMFNPDGSEDDCGNGLRCIVRFIHERLGGPREFQVETRSAIHHAEVLEHGPRRSLIRVVMAEPLFAPESIPTTLSAIFDYPLRIGDREHRIHLVNTGSTHCVIFLPGPVQDDVFRDDSPLIEHHEVFPQRTSVIWTWADGPGRFRVRIWERGVGETLGCGTGACAAAVSAHSADLAGERIEIVSGGGTLTIEWSGEGPIRMTGPARTVYEGLWAGETAEPVS